MQWLITIIAALLIASRIGAVAFYGSKPTRPETLWFAFLYS
jgi:hypothetical protein